MFITMRKLQKAILEVVGGKEENHLAVSVLKKELEELKLKKRIEEEEIKHLVKMKEEKNEIENQKRQIELERKFQEKEMQLLKQHQDKVLTVIENSGRETKELYQAIMARLPNVNVEMKR